MYYGVIEKMSSTETSSVGGTVKLAKSVSIYNTNHNVTNDYNKITLYLYYHHALGEEKCGHRHLSLKHTPQDNVGVKKPPKP